jgi:flagellar hook-length control protein FliK
MDDLQILIAGPSAQTSLARRVPQDEGDKAAFLSAFSADEDLVTAESMGLGPQMPGPAMSEPQDGELVFADASRTMLHWVASAVPQSAPDASDPLTPRLDLAASNPMTAGTAQDGFGAAIEARAANPGASTMPLAKDVESPPHGMAPAVSNADRTLTPPPVIIGQTATASAADGKAARSDPTGLDLAITGADTLRVTARAQASADAGGLNPIPDWVAQERGNAVAKAASMAGFSVGDRAEALVGATSGQAQPGPAVAVERALPPELPQHTTRQIATALAAISHDPGSAVDIALDPPELGRVRLSLTEVNGAMMVSIAAERPETADLIRRHLVLLADEFARLGLDAPSVDVSGGGPWGQDARHAHPGAPLKDGSLADLAAPLAASLSSPGVKRGGDGGLDLRL